MTLVHGRRHPAATTVAERIQQDTMDRLRFYAEHPDRIDGRLRVLDAEWSAERVMHGGGAALALAGTLLGAGVDRRWLAVPAAAGALVLQQAVDGRSPPFDLLRRAGLRTAREIETERGALKVLRGDYIGVPDAPPPTRAAASLAAAQT